MDPSVIRNALNPTTDGLSLDANFEIADLPVKLELRYAIESKRAANGLECPKTEYKPMNKKSEVSFIQEYKQIYSCVSQCPVCARAIVLCCAFVQTPRNGK